MKNYYQYTFSIIILFLIMTSCQDENFPTPHAANIQTVEVSDVTGATAISGGIIFSDGGDEISTQGICWDTIPDPVLGRRSKRDTTEQESFTCEISGLKGGTTYYVRAYATNNGGISFGENISFTTNEVPVLETAKAYEITGYSAKCGGEIVKDFGLQISEVGVCWSEDADPSIEDSKADGQLVGDSFTAEITDLEPCTDYHVRAYAISSNGDVGYGDEVIFSTLIIDYDGNFYTSVEIGSQVWMVENYKCTHFADGSDLAAVQFHSGDVNEEFGASYLWTDIIKDNFAPKGWHVPTDEEWAALNSYIEGKGLLLKEPGTDHWNTDNGTNETGFTAFGSGHIYGAALKSETTWWTSTENSNASSQGIRWSLFDSGDMGRYANEKTFMFTVRLIKD